MTLNILGMGYCHPSTIIDNQFLRNLDIDSDPDWIIEKIGIETRRSCLPLDYIKETKNKDPRAAEELLEMTPAQMGARAAEMAVKQVGIEASEIGLVVCNCCTPLQTCPAVAQQIAGMLDLSVAAYDVFSACPAFALHTDLIYSMRPERLPEYVLCISTGSMTSRVDYANRADSAIWGDGAAAWILSPRQSGKLRVVKTHFMANPRRAHAVVVDTNGFFHQEGRVVRDFSVRQTVRMIKQFEREAENNIDWSRDIFIGHQANATMLEQITKNRGIGKDNHWSNVRVYGNQAGAGAPAVLAMHWDKITAGQKIVVAVVGAGLSWGSILLEGQS
jgi:3-oxoacyl-[acyl-carrier-protein] synthase-3